MRVDKSFEIYFKIEVSKIILKVWGLNLKEIGILKVIWELDFLKLNYELESWKLFEDEILKINK